MRKITRSIGSIILATALLTVGCGNDDPTTAPGGMSGEMSVDEIKGWWQFSGGTKTLGIIEGTNSWVFEVPEWADGVPHGEIRSWQFEFCGTFDQWYLVKSDAGSVTLFLTWNDAAGISGTTIFTKPSENELGVTVDGTTGYYHRITDPCPGDQ